MLLERFRAHSGRCYTHALAVAIVTLRRSHDSLRFWGDWVENKNAGSHRHPTIQKQRVEVKEAAGNETPVIAVANAQ